jgi:plasmid stabilization system protein ParE
MAYNLIVSPRAQKEIENAIDYYLLYSIDAPKNFIEALQVVYTSLEQTPLQNRIRYKNVRALKLKKFPYLVYYTINDNKQTVRLLSCFHSKRNPKKRPRY